MGHIRGLGLVKAMKINLTYHIFLSLGWIGLPCQSQAGLDEISATGREMLGKGIYVYAATDDVAAYPTPNDGSSPVNHMRWFQSIPIDNSLLSSTPEGWLPIKEDHGKPASWVRRRDVVIGDQMRKVVACWPIKLIHLSFGDYAGEFVFDKTGSGKVVYELGHTYPDSQARRYSRIQVYMEGNVVQFVRLNTATNDIIEPAGYRAETQRLYPWGAPAEKQVNFPASDLKGCASIPVLGKPAARSIRFTPEEWDNARRK